MFNPGVCSDFRELIMRICRDQGRPFWFTETVCTHGWWHEVAAVGMAAPGLNLSLGRADVTSKEKIVGDHILCLAV